MTWWHWRSRHVYLVLLFINRTYPSSGRSASLPPVTMASFLAGDDSLPCYEVGGDPLPLYSCNVASSECLLQIEPPRLTGCPACDWMFETKHMRINLGPRLWNLHSPSYGLNGKIEGTIRLTGDQNRVDCVTMTVCTLCLLSSVVH
jgi:hypothetical protein